MSKNLAQKAFVRDITAEFDKWEKDFIKRLQEVSQDSVRKHLPGILERSQDYFGAAWSEAVQKVEEQVTPRAYVRTDALSDADIVSVSMGGTALFENLRTGEGFVFTIFVKLDPTDTAAYHREAQHSLDNASKEDRFKIQYPSMDQKSGKSTDFLYPAVTSPHIEPEVIGSFWTQTKPYLIQYLFAGPNMPNQPEVYRHLGHEGNIGSLRADDRGRDILDAFMRNMGVIPVPVEESSLEASTTFDPALNRRGNVVMEIMEGLGRRIEESFHVDASLEIELGE